MAEDDPPRHSARRPVLLPTAPCLRGQGFRPDLRYRDYLPGDRPTTDRGKPVAAWQRLSGTYNEIQPWLECAERYDRAHTIHGMDPLRYTTTHQRQARAEASGGLMIMNWMPAGV